MTTPAPSSTTVNPAAHLPEAFTVDSPELHAAVSARTPIRFTSANEPYIPLPAPHERFHLGTMRQSDVQQDAAMMVCPYLVYFLPPVYVETQG